ncbi:MAG: hypothetical protein JW810_04925, partial [Sedimentisphaerales bacterium]|nr:hypothetical protein [Sedimentisphaerales bacterium]
GGLCHTRNDPKKTTSRSVEEPTVTAANSPLRQAIRSDLWIRFTSRPRGEVKWAGFGAEPQDERNVSAGDTTILHFDIVWRCGIAAH